jgi:tetratricopeptide (TPR) repeat protein
MDWSYSLLSDVEKQMLRRLAVFVGTFDLHAVESICCLTAGEKLEALDILTSLAYKSMLVAERLPGLDMRYRLLETIRQFAHDKLKASGENPHLRQAHARHYLERALETGREMFSRQAPHLVRQMQADLPNVRVSFSFVLESPEPEPAVDALNALWFFWLLSGSAEEGRALMERALGKLGSEQPSIARASLLRNLGLLSIIQGRSKEALALVTFSREMSHTLNDRSGYAWACLWMGSTSWGEYQNYEESARIHKELGDEDSYAFTVWLWGCNSRNYGDLEQAERLLAEAEAFYRRKDSWYIASVYFNQARLYFNRGDLPRARRLYMQSLPIILEVGSQWEEMWWHRWWGEMILAEATDGASLREAEIELMKTIRLAEKFGNRQFFLLSTPVLLADKALQLGEFSKARQYYHLSLIYYQNLFLSGVSDFGEDDYRNLSGCFLGLAEMAATCSRLTETSARLLGAVICIGAAAEEGWDEIQSARIQRIAEVIRAGLGSESYPTAWEKGKALSLEQAVNLAFEVSGELPAPGEHDSSSEIA